MVLKIGVFVISISDDHILNYVPSYEKQDINLLKKRWLLEKEYWNNNKNVNKQFTIHLLECNKNKYNNKHFDSKCLNCEETFTPGIFQKTYYALKHYNDYDIYIRTNLSTFFIFDRMIKYLQNIPLNTPIYNGTIWYNPYYKKLFNIHNFVYAQGSCIIMNKKSRDIFIDKGINYINSNEADDALISKIFYDNNIYLNNCNYYKTVYLYNYRLSVKHNIKYIDDNDIFNIRLKTDDLISYKKVIDYLTYNYNLCIKIYYGTDKIKIDVTQECFDNLLNNNFITIPNKDTVRSEIFGDPIYGTLKKIYIKHKDKTIEYDHNNVVNLNIYSSL